MAEIGTFVRGNSAMSGKVVMVTFVRGNLGRFVMEKSSVDRKWVWVRWKFLLRVLT